MAARLCAEAAPWQVLVSRRVHLAVEDDVVAVLVGDLQPRGFSKPVRVYDVRHIRDQEETG
jgi:class 3 adenylate cyclase